MALISLFHSAAEPLQPVRDGIRKRPLVLGGGLQADEIFFEDGVATAPHAHEFEQAAYQVSGEFQVTLGTQHRRVAPGDAYQIPAGTPHAVRCLRQGSYVLITARHAPGGHDHEHANQSRDHDHHDQSH
jgi:quercetin dioxygenase-like cupin family protein